MSVMYGRISFALQNLVDDNISGMHEARESSIAKGRTIEKCLCEKCAVCMGKKQFREGVYVGYDLKQSEQKEKSNLRVVVVDGGLSDEKNVGLAISRRH